MITPDFLAAVSASDICPAYYALAQEHPVRLGMPLATTAAKQVLDAAQGTIPLEPLRGPGSTYRVLDLPEGVALYFLLQGRTDVETGFEVQFNGVAERGSFTVLCHDASELNGGSAPEPPYPRPTFHSLTELVAILTQFDGLVRRLGDLQASGAERPR